MQAQRFAVATCLVSDPQKGHLRQGRFDAKDRTAPAINEKSHGRYFDSSRCPTGGACLALAELGYSGD